MKIIKEILPEKIIPAKEVNRYILESGNKFNDFDTANYHLCAFSKYTDFVKSILEEKIPWDKDFIKQIIKLNLDSSVNLYYILSPNFEPEIYNLILSKFTRSRRDDENIQKFKNTHIIYFYLHDDSSHWQLVYIPYDFFNENIL